MNTSGDRSFIAEELSVPSEIVELDAQYFNSPWSKTQWADTDLNYHKLFTWRNGDLIKGFALLQIIPGDLQAHLLKICLIKEVQGTGESIKFWHELAKILGQSEINSIFLEVEKSNKRALGFYLKLGFKNLRLVKNFYSNGESAQTMLLTL